MEMQRYLRKKRVAHKVIPVNFEETRRRRNFMPSESKMLAKKIAMEVSGLAPYEKKAIDIIKTDNLKKVRGFLKKRLGSISRAEKKFKQLYSLKK